MVAGAFADNAASLRVMSRIGMRIEARTVRGSLHRDLGWVDGVEAAVLAEEWRRRTETALTAPGSTAKVAAVTFDRISWPRRTERLTFRPATHDDLDALGRIQNQPEVAYWLPTTVGTQADYLLRMGARRAPAPDPGGGAGRRRHR